MEFVRKLEKDGILREDKDYPDKGKQLAFRVVRAGSLPRSLLDEWLTHGVIRA